MGTPLKNPPVYFTVVQVRFNTILKLADFLPGIQESFRRDGYPDFTTQKVVSLQVTIQDGQPAPVPVQHERFLFGNAEKTHIFVLDGQMLALQSTNYGQFETFSETFLEGLRTVHEAVQLAYTERVGLRYLDRVIAAEGDTLEHYLAVQVHGLGSRLGGNALYSYSEALNAVEDIQLRSRVAIQDGGLAFPPDIQPGPMPVAARFVEYEGLSAILDNDGFVEKREAYSAEGVAKHLSAIHDVIGAAFKATATPHAFTVWNR